MDIGNTTSEHHEASSGAAEKQPVFLDPAWRTRLRDRLARDEEFTHIARWTTVTIELSAPMGSATFTLRAGCLGVEPSESGAAMVRLDASAERWAEFFSPTPAPWHNDMLGLSRRHPDVHLDPGGDTLVRHLRVLNRMWEVARETD